VQAATKGGTRYGAAACALHAVAFTCGQASGQSAADSTLSCV